MMMRAHKSELSPPQSTADSLSRGERVGVRGCNL